MEPPLPLLHLLMPNWLQAFPQTNSNDGADMNNGAANVTVTYHTSLANANAGTAVIGPNYNAANNTIVYARVKTTPPVVLLLLK